MQVTLRLITLAFLSPLSLAAQGTLVKDISLGASYPGPFVALGDKVVFPATRPDIGEELWASDGTEAGTVLLRDIHPSGGAFIEDLTLFRDRVLFFALDESAWRLWSTNATGVGTVPVADMPLFEQGSLGPMAATSDHVIFFVDGADNTIWRSDGTTAGTLAVTTCGFLDPDLELGVFRDEVYFTHSGYFAGSNGLWKTDGTAAGTVFLYGFVAGFGHPRDYTVAGDYLYFKADTPEGIELWRTDGTTDGTMLVKDIYVGPFSSNPSYLVALDSGLLLFSAGSASLASALWKSDGTPEGTVPIFTPPSPTSGVQALTSFGDDAWFIVTSPFETIELWRTDGTVSGTYEIAQHVSLIGNFITVGSSKLIVWTGGEAVSDTGYEPYVSDGTTAGTKLAADVWPGRRTSFADLYTRAGNKIFFRADDGEHSFELHALSLSDLGGWVAEPFGTGCGLASVPALALAGELTGGSSVSFVLDGAAPLAPAALYCSKSSAHDFLGSCTIYLAQPHFVALSATDASGVLSLPASVPDDPALAGVFAAVQAATIAPGGPFLGFAELSNGLELVIGK